MLMHFPLTLMLQIGRSPKLLKSTLETFPEYGYATKYQTHVLDTSNPFPTWLLETRYTTGK